MKALPSIAFNDFSGAAKDVTARQFRGRTVLTFRPFPSKVVSSSQKTNRNAMDKISRAFKTLSDAQIAGWSALGEPLHSESVLGGSIGLTAHNAFVPRTATARWPGCLSLWMHPLTWSTSPTWSMRRFG